MAATVTYTTVNGEILHENRGGVESFYVPDPIGNTAALVNASGALTDAWSYWPYGEVLEHGGSSGTPFTYVGTAGCYTDPCGSIYARARELEPPLTRWITVDRVWSNLPPYAYGFSNPITYADSSGFAPAKGASHAGVGPGDCPGQDAVDYLTSLLHSKPRCLNAFLSLCGGEAMVQLMWSITFVVEPLCIPKSPTTPNCMDFHNNPTNPLRPGNPCTPDDICFSSFRCSQGTKERANGLLFELGNWCNCFFHNNKGGEAPTEKLCLACGFPSDWCIGGGIFK